MAKTVLRNLVRDVTVLPLGKKVVTNVQFYRDVDSLFTVEEKRQGVVLTRTSYPNYMYDRILSEWITKGYS